MVAAAPLAPELRALARPVSLAGERLLPVLPALAPLLPGGGLRRGTTVAVAGGAGATSLTLALVAGASAAGSWCAAVGCPSLGLVAAAELGVALERFPLVSAPPPGEWATVVAALLDALDVVVAWTPRGARPGEVRRLRARARERGAVLVLAGAGAAAVDGVETRLSVDRSAWSGLGRGCGHLAARVVDVRASGRGAAARPRRARLWLPGPDGEVATAPAEAPSGFRERSATKIVAARSQNGRAQAS